MTPLWNDTDPDTETEMLRLLGRASVAERFAMAEALTTSVVTWSRRALEKNRPTASRREILLEWAGLHYGHEIEQELRDYVVASSDD